MEKDCTTTLSRDTACRVLSHIHWTHTRHLGCLDPPGHYRWPSDRGLEMRAAPEARTVPTWSRSLSDPGFKRAPRSADRSYRLPPFFCATAIARAARPLADGCSPATLPPLVRSLCEAGAGTGLARHEAEPPLSPHIPTRPRLRLPCAELRRAPANAPPPSPTLESVRVAVFVCLRFVALPPPSPSPPRLSCIVALGALRWTRAVTRGGARCRTTHIRTSRAVGRCVSIDASWRSCGRVVVRVGGRSGVHEALGKGGGRSCGSDAVGRDVGPAT